MSKPAHTPEPRKPAKPPVGKPPAGKPAREPVVERDLDEALEETFPASDPIAVDPEPRRRS
ncbi:hypothetical protein CAL29_23450 [Bordetella genomosp. 10]|uniref:Uncharacterized protein n=1 Tax=Bordetella genomosp. 10 TaxID=1416804 RepID=A0A261S7N0_9BORD|nr:hypothetical protein [Bordetella genomosp. 10]OZI32443.1 hypothetical protein CAL29_23450 [Bordetella genomosp. 10]